MLQKYIPACMATMLLLSSCSISKKINKQAETLILNDSALTSAHIGISIFEPATNKYWYNHDADKYFIPASNTKIFTCYAAMKYLGDSLPGIRIQEMGEWVIVRGTGDPTLLAPEFKNQPVYNYLQKIDKTLHFDDSNWKTTRLGRGWAWDDYSEDYCVERSALPIYNNLYRFYIENNELKSQPPYRQDIYKDYERTQYPYSNALPYFHINNLPPKFTVKRHALDDAAATIAESATTFKGIDLPRKVNDFDNFNLLMDTLYHTSEAIVSSGTQHASYPGAFKTVIRSQPVDSFLKPMMHRSDNFFAEQALLMVSNEQLGYMNDAAIIDTILKTDFKSIPQKPRWVDGSGLSRYNLFTPQSIVWVLNKMHAEFSMERIKEIMATGGEGTLNNYYAKLKGNIFAKTGTLSNHCALSGFLVTKKGKLLIFSILTGSYPGGATAVRRAVEKFIVGIYEEY